MRALLPVLAFAVAAAPAHAARPFVTDDARIVDEGGCQIETFLKSQQAYKGSEFGFLPACNPWGRVELSFGGVWVKSTLPGDSRTLIFQGKTVLKPLETNGSGFGLTLGVGRARPHEAPHVASPYFNAIGSFSFAHDRVVMHANLGGVRDKAANLSRATWGVGAEVLLAAPRWYGIAETYGQRKDKPTFHTGLRFWIVPNRMQVDATVGAQHAAPFDRRFGTIGLRVLW